MDELRFSAIYLKDQSYKEYVYKNGNDFLDNLSQVNIFVGKNNAGKSRFLRKLFADEKIKFLAPLLDITKIDERLERFRNEFEEIRHDKNTRYFDEYADIVKSMKNFIYLTNGVDFDKLLKDFSKLPASPPLFSYNLSVNERLEKLILNAKNFFFDALPTQEGTTVFSFENYYVPILRGMRSIASNEEQVYHFKDIDAYKNRTLNDYFNRKQPLNVTIFTGLGLYEDLDNYKRGTAQEQDNVERFEEFLSETFFNNMRVRLTAEKNRKIVCVRIENHNYPIYHLGDGIQALIILTYPLFFNQGKNLKVYMEEPELHLHPGYQRTFIETLLRPEFEKFQYFITTHSNHFLDMTLDKQNISVYRFTQIAGDEPKFHIENVENDDKNTLQLLGVRNSSVFLSNCTIWVEGITDRIYIRKYLELYQKKHKARVFSEDTHYSFVEYAGNNITHWSFLDSEDETHPNILTDSLCGRLFLITDRDNAGLTKRGKLSKKSLRFQALQKTLGDDQYYCLKCKEIENLITPQILQKTIIAQEKLRNEKTLKFPKIKYEAYFNKPLGKFIDKLDLGLSKKYEDGNTINDKLPFAKAAVASMESFDDLSEEAQELAKRLYDFIAENNN